MAKLDVTVLVYSSSTKELASLRSALEPVISRFREASNLPDACNKAKNEVPALIVIGSDTEAVREYQDFYPFARGESSLKQVPIFVWAPTSPVLPVADSLLKFFPRGQFRQLVEALDHLVMPESSEDIARKTKIALPAFMQGFGEVAAQKFGRALGAPLSAAGWIQARPDKHLIRATVTSRTRLLECQWVLCSPEGVGKPEALNGALRDCLQSAALKTVAVLPELSMQNFELGLPNEKFDPSWLAGDEAWNSMPLQNATRETVARVFMKLRARR